MQVTLERLSPVLIEFKVTVPVERVKQSMDRAYESLARSAHIKGFRKGKAPRQVLMHLFGDRVAADVASRLVDDTLSNVLAQHKVRPISNPVVEKPKVTQTDDFTYRARFEVTPEIDKVDYEGMQVTRRIDKVGDAEIDAEIERLRHRHATLRAPVDERAAALGDVVVFDFTLTVAGQPVPGGEAKDVSAELGNNSLLPEIGKALLGKKDNDAFDLEVQFPGNYAREEMRGKLGVFHVVVKQVKERILPAIDDEFAKDVGDFDTLEALRASVRERLEKEAKERSDTAVAEALIVELCRRNPVPVPPSLVRQQAQLQESEILAQTRRQGNQAKNLSADLRQRVEADAELKVRAGLLMAEIAKKLQIKITDEDVQKAQEELAEQTGKNINKIKVQYQDPKQREMLMGMILEDKVLDVLEASARIVDGDGGNASDPRWATPPEHATAADAPAEPSPDTSDELNKG